MIRVTVLALLAIAFAAAAGVVGAPQPVPEAALAAREREHVTGVMADTSELSPHPSRWQRSPRHRASPLDLSGDALPRLIVEIRARGYEIVAIRECL